MNLKQIREMSDNICNYRVRIATLEAEDAVRAWNQPIEGGEK